MFQWNWKGFHNIRTIFFYFFFTIVTAVTVTGSIFFSCEKLHDPTRLFKVIARALLGSVLVATMPGFSVYCYVAAG